MSPLWIIGEVSVNHLQILCDFSVGVEGVLCEVSALCLIFCPLPLDLRIAYGVAMSILINHIINVHDYNFDININSIMKS